MSLDEQDVLWIAVPKLNGCGMVGVFTCLTDRPSQCLTPQQISLNILNHPINARDLGVQWQGCEQSSHFRAELLSTWQSAVTQVKAKANSGCYDAYWMRFAPGDIMVADRLMCSWVELTALQCRGIDFVVRLAVTRKLDFRRGQRLGKDDQIVNWPKRYARSKANSGYRKNLPDSLRVRVCRIRITRPGFREKVLVIATTLFDPIEFPKEELASLYRKRWNVELDIRTLKQTLQMDQLRCKHPTSFERKCGRMC